MTFVPEFRTSGEADPWAHRKGEPRLFTLFWAVYLMSAALLTIFGTRALAPPAVAQYRFGCQSMLLLTAVGITVLWPVTRLSQAAPARPGRAAAMDLAAVLLPVQAVVWPMPFLTRWPFEVIGALALLLTTWGVVAACTIATGVRGRTLGSRTTAMAALLVAALAGPAVMSGYALFAVGSEPPRFWAWLSPFVGVYALTESPAHRAPEVPAAAWFVVAAPGIAALLLAPIGSRFANSRTPL